MYQEMMQAIRKNLFKKGSTQGLTFTVELLPWRQPDGKMYVFQIFRLFLRLLTLMNKLTIFPFPNVP